MSTATIRYSVGYYQIAMAVEIDADLKQRNFENLPVVEVQTSWLSHDPPVPQHMSLKSSSLVQSRCPFASHVPLASA